MNKIVPTILANNAENFRRLEAIYSTFAKRIQIDICDNDFAKTSTVNVNDIVLANTSSIIYDFHMMVQNPSTYIDRIISLKPSLCIFHAECNENLLPIFEKLKTAKIRTGVCLLKTTFPGKIKPYIEAADHVLIFAGKLGQQGGEADMLQIEKVPIIRSINPNIEIGWDGGASMNNIRALAHSNIDIINVGGALSQSPNPAEVYKELDAESNKNGVII